MTQLASTQKDTSVVTENEPLVIRQDSRDNRSVVTLTLNNPKQFNALSVALLSALQKELDAIAEDQTI